MSRMRPPRGRGTQGKRTITPAERIEAGRIVLRNDRDPAHFTYEDGLPLSGQYMQVIVRNRLNEKVARVRVDPGESWLPWFEERLKAGAFD